MRRSNQFIQTAGFLLLILALGAGNVSAGLPTDQIKATVDKALTVLRDPRFKQPAKLNDRRDQLRQILFARFDFTEMAKRALGANWRRRTAQEQEESKATLTVLEDDERTVTLSFASTDYEELQQRFEITSEDEMSTAIRDCLTSGVAFTLDAKQLAKALRVFHCDGNLGELSDIIKQQLLKKL